MQTENQKNGLRQRLLDSAMDVLASDGLPGLSLREIARRARVSHGAPLYYFPSLSSLLTEVATQGFRDLFASVQEAVGRLGEDASPRNRVLAATHAYVDFALANPAHYQLMFMDEMLDTRSPSFVDTVLVSGRHGIDLLRAYQQTGWHPEIAPERLVLAYWASVHGTIVLWLQRVMHNLTGDETIADMLDAVVTMTLGTACS